MLHDRQIDSCTGSQRDAHKHTYITMPGQPECLMPKQPVAGGGVIIAQFCSVAR